ncbi:MAG TPA: hypothetical protein VF346_09540 [Bacteroidales bacterium]
MKKLSSFFALQTLVIMALQAQPVSEYTYKLDNGITVKTERCWNQVWVQQDYSPLKADEKTPLSVITRILGDLSSGSSFKLLRSGKEVKMLGATPGTYDLKLSFKLSGKPGTLSFVVGNVLIKPQTKTIVTITLYDYQIAITESAGSLKGLALYDLKINKFKGNTEQSSNMGIPSFFAKDKHNKPVTPDESTNNTSGKIKPGTYDVLISIGISGQAQKVWLENFTMKPDVNYMITANLNGGVIIYTGANKQIKNMHLYPAGTAAKQTGTPAPIKNLELGSYDNLTLTNACPPGAYDVLLTIGNGAKYEWRKNLVVKTGSRTEVK